MAKWIANYTDRRDTCPMQVWTLKDDRAYVLTYTAPVDDYEEFEQTVQDMIESLEFDD